MKVRLSNSSTEAILFALILCQFAKALQPVNLAMCDETPDSVPQCIVHDSMGDKQYLHANATSSLLIKLPVPVLTELWLDHSKIEIVTSSGMVINMGQQIISSHDRDRWIIKFNFWHVDIDYGMLNLVLHIRDVKYRDTQYLHVEIKSVITIFQTTKKIWIPVQEKSNERDNDHGEAANTTVNPAECETCQNETEDLQRKLMTIETDLSQYQMKYFHCLESKDDSISGTVKPNVYGKVKKGLDIITLALMLSGTGVMAYVVFMLRGSKLKTTEYNSIKSDGGILVLPNSAVTFKDGESLRDLLSTPQDV